MLLELGGKAPLIVLADADLERAAAAASFGAFFHQGQICMSTERIVVDRAVAEPLAEKLAERARALTVGDPREPDDRRSGRSSTEAALERVSELVDDAAQQGRDERSAAARPTVRASRPPCCSGVTPEMRVYARGVVRAAGRRSIAGRRRR